MGGDSDRSRCRWPVSGSGHTAPAWCLVLDLAEPGPRPPLHDRGHREQRLKPAPQLRSRLPAGPGGGWLRAGGQHADGARHDRLLRDEPRHIARSGADPASLATLAAAVLRARQRRFDVHSNRMGSCAARPVAEGTRARDAGNSVAADLPPRSAEHRSHAWRVRHRRSQHGNARAGGSPAEHAYDDHLVVAFRRLRPDRRRHLGADRDDRRCRGRLMDRCSAVLAPAQSGAAKL
jgi:hypothetical protein